MKEVSVEVVKVTLFKDGNTISCFLPISEYFVTQFLRCFSQSGVQVTIDGFDTIKF